MWRNLEMPPFDRSPWRWVPALFFLQALPYLVVTFLAPLAFQDLKIEKLTFAAWIGLASLPWTLKLLWAPLVDLSARKRTWVTVTQPIIVVLMLAVAASFSAGSTAFPVILAALAVLGIASATHDIAADGFYLLALPQEKQARFVGVLTTSGRMGKLFCQFGLLFLVGKLMKIGGLTPATAWSVTFMALAGVFAIGAAWNWMMLPKTEPPAARHPGLRGAAARTAGLLLAGLTLYFALAGALRAVGHTLSPHVGGDAWSQTATGLRVWTAIGVATALALGPVFALAGNLLRGSDIGRALSSYVRQPRFGSILFFIVTYRLGEAMLGFLSTLFLRDKLENGGLALDADKVAAVTGIAGVLGIVVGGLLGGWYIARVGLRHAFWPLAVVMHLPNLLFVYAAYVRPPIWQLYPIMFVDQLGYGFGFAAYFVYLMYVAQRTPEFRTAHYAIGTGLGALIVSTLAPSLSTIIQSAVGYKGFFIACCVLTLPGMLALLLIPLHPEEDPASYSLKR